MAKSKKYELLKEPMRRKKMFKIIAGVLFLLIVWVERANADHFPGQVDFLNSLPIIQQAVCKIEGDEKFYFCQILTDYASQQAYLAITEIETKIVRKVWRFSP